MPARWIFPGSRPRNRDDNVRSVAPAGDFRNLSLCRRGVEGAGHRQARAPGFQREPAGAQPARCRGLCPGGGGAASLSGRWSDSYSHGYRRASRPRPGAHHLWHRFRRNLCVARQFLCRRRRRGSLFRPWFPGLPDRCAQCRRDPGHGPGNPPKDRYRRAIVCRHAAYPDDLPGQSEQPDRQLLDDRRDRPAAESIAGDSAAGAGCGLCRICRP